MYDYLVVGAGFFGSVFAYEASKRGKKVLVIDKRANIGGNCFTQNQNGINIHKFGAHIFHTSDERVYSFICDLCEIFLILSWQILRAKFTICPLI